MASPAVQGTPSPLGGLSSSPATSAFLITPGAPFTKGTCRSIACGTAGTLNYTDSDGNVITGFPLQAGYNPIAAQSVQTGGSASNIWALY